MTEEGSGSAPVYLDVVGAAHDLPEDEGQWLRLQLEPVELVFVARPGLRGDRITLQNLVLNPGMDAPFGGGVSPNAPLVFNDPLTNFNAYTIQAMPQGGALSQDSTFYSDLVQQDNPVRYFRLDEPAGGTTGYDVTGNGNGTYTGGVTHGVAGALVGDPDTAVSFDGSTGALAGVGPYLPGGSTAFTLECWLKQTAVPATGLIALCVGNWAVNGQAAFLGADQTGKAQGGINGTLTLNTQAALALNVWHHLVVTFSGGTNGTNGTLALYLDGALQATGVVTPQLTYTGSAFVSVGCNTALGRFFAGAVDEVAVYGTALTAGRVQAHSTLGHGGPTAGQANTLLLPAGGRVSFGSPSWGALRSWQVRFRFNAGATISFRLHQTDATDYLEVWLNGSGLNADQTVAGVAHALAPYAPLTLVPGVWYWLQVTQTPSVALNPPQVVASVLADSGASAPGSVLATLGPAATALVGQPQLAVSGAALGLGGAASGGNQVAAWGPGAWSFVSSGTAVASGAWEQQAANTTTLGPVASAGAARVDVAPAGTAGQGTLNAAWYAADISTAGQIQKTAQPVAVSGQTPNVTLGISAHVRAVGVSATCQVSLAVNEYDANGNYLRRTVLDLECALVAVPRGTRMGTTCGGRCSGGRGA